MRVVILPDWRAGNPYQQLLADALADFGVEVLFPKGYRRILPLSRELLPAPRPDLLHLHWPSPFLRSNRTIFRAAYCLRTLVDVAIVRRAGIKVVWTVHNLVTHDTPTPKLERWFSKRLAGLASTLIVHTKAARETVIEELGATRTKICIIPHGSFSSVYGEAPKRQDARKALGLNPGVKVALFFGLIRPYKGVPKLLKAWGALGDERGNAQLIVAGAVPDPNYEAKIRSMAASLENTRLYLRHMQPEEIPVLMAAADLMVLPFENNLTSGTMRLARDYHLPVLTPDFTDSSCGYRATSHPSLTKSLAQALKEPGAFRSVAEPHVSWQTIGKKHYKAYRED